MIGTRASNTAANAPNTGIKDTNELTTTSGEISTENVNSPANLNDVSKIIVEEFISLFFCFQYNNDEIKKNYLLSSNLHLV